MCFKDLTVLTAHALGFSPYVLRVPQGPTVTFYTQNPWGISPTLICVREIPDGINRPNLRVCAQRVFHILQGRNSTYLRNPWINFKCSSEVLQGHCGTPIPNPRVTVGLQSKCLYGSLYKREAICHLVGIWNLTVYIYILVHGDRLWSWFMSTNCRINQVPKNRQLQKLKSFRGQKDFNCPNEQGLSCILICDRPSPCRLLFKLPFQEGHLRLPKVSFPVTQDGSLPRSLNKPPHLIVLKTVRQKYVICSFFLCKN